VLLEREGLLDGGEEWPLDVGPSSIEILFFIWGGVHEHTLTLKSVSAADDRDIWSKKWVYMD